MRIAPLALAVPIILAACGPVVYVTPTGGDGVLLPEQIQRAADAYTATARVEATRDAQATATGQSARETATAASLGTLGALAARQTEAGVSMTLAAANAEFTQVAAQSTENYRATQAWSTPTAAALRAAATAQAADDARRTAQAENVGEFWRTLRIIITLLFVVGGLSAICVVVVDAVTRIKVARLAQQAAIAREAFRLLPPGHWAEWAPGEGYQVYPLPGLLDAPATVIENAAPTTNRAHEWRQAVRLFCHWGDVHGFGIEHLGASGAGVVTDPGWRVLSKLLKDAGVLANRAIPGQKGRVTAWADDWSYRRLFDDLAHGRLSLPFPPDDPAPKVAFTVPTQQQN